MNAKRISAVSIVLNILLVIVSCVLVAKLIEARTTDTVRMTLTKEQVYGYEVGPFARQLNVITGKAVYVEPIDSNNVLTAKRYRLIVDYNESVNEG